MRNVLFSSSDFELFDPDITPQDYEFYQKHKDALKSLLEDQVLKWSVKIMISLPSKLPRIEIGVRSYEFVFFHFYQV